MKFKSISDMQMFLLEVKQDPSLASESFEPTVEMLEVYMNVRRGMLPKLKNFRRSQSGKEAWRHHRYKFIKGIRGFHRSTAGKKFHRNISRFLSTREHGRRFIKSEAIDFASILPVVELLKGISSLKTHLLIELDYYQSLNEDIDLHILIEEVVPALSRLEEALVHAKACDRNDIDLLIALLNPKDVLEAFSEDATVDTVKIANEAFGFDVSELGFGFEDTGSYVDFLLRLHEAS